MVTKRPFKLNQTRILMLIFCVSVFYLAAACRPVSNLQPTDFPTLAPTPRSTPLPAIATAVAPGQADNPLQMVIRPDGNIQTARGAAADFESAVLNQSGLVIQVKIVERYAEALAALCGSSGGSASTAWLNGMTYTAAEAQNCGQPLMQVQRTVGTATQNGEAVSIIIKNDANISSVGSLKNKIFCRISYDDMSTWLLPSLVLEANGVPALSLKAVNDYSDIPKMVKAVAAGDCDAAGIPADALEQFADDIGDAGNQVKTLTTSIEFPYAILMVPVEVPLGTRLSLVNTLKALAAKSDTAVKMRALLGQKTLVAANSNDFSELADFMASTGLNFAQLGN